ncbi:MAG TPA: MFS transporter [Candidatus Megaira endosymbiont of Hartmannula sinica]|nr:MFS transporter [Candidatus Megaera endosymbiont of Hartmannula sinica]
MEAVFSLSIGKIFFPSSDPYISLLMSLAAFALGFVTRPIGGILFGHIADIYGRKKSLVISVGGMTITTLVIGLIPSYNSIGFFAPFFLIIMRLIQGMCISGEGAGAAIFILEHYGNFKPGFIAGLVNASNIAGTLIASLIGIILSFMIGDDEYSFRIAFVIGALIGILSFYSRIKMSETPVFKMLAEKKQVLKSPFFHVVKNSYKAMFITFILGGAASSVVYLSKTYINVYYCDVMNFNHNKARLYLAYASIIMMISMPISGYISDIIGRFKMIIITNISVILFSIPSLLLITSETFLYQILGVTTLASMGGFIAGSAYIFIISLFDAKERFSGVSFSYNLGIAIFGGTSAAISRILVECSGMHFAPSLYVIFTNLMLLVTLFYMKEYIINRINIYNRNNKKL